MIEVDAASSPKPYDVSSSGSGGRGWLRRSLLLVAVQGNVLLSENDEVLKGKQSCDGVLRARQKRRRKATLISSKAEKRNSKHLFSPRPHGQLAASSVMSVVLGDDVRRAARAGMNFKGRGAERHQSWSVSQWKTEKKKKREEREKRSRPPRRKHRNPERKKTALSVSLFFFTPYHEVDD